MVVITTLMTPIGLGFGVYEAFRLAGGLAVLMIALVSLISVAMATVVTTVRRERREEQSARAAKAARRTSRSERGRRVIPRFCGNSSQQAYFTHALHLLHGELLLLVPNSALLVLRAYTAFESSGFGFDHAIHGILRRHGQGVRRPTAGLEFESGTAAESAHVIARQTVRPVCERNQGPSLKCC
jgi:hypothetical protein